MLARESQEEKSFGRSPIKTLSREISPHPMMSRRGINGGHGGCGYTERRRDRGLNYSGANRASKKGLCSDLGKNFFNCGHKDKVYRMITSREKLFQNVVTKYGQDIINLLNSKLKVNLVTPVYSNEVLVRHATQEALVHTG